VRLPTNPRLFSRNSYPSRAATASARRTPTHGSSRITGTATRAPPMNSATASTRAVGSEISPVTSGRPGWFVRSPSRSRRSLRTFPPAVTREVETAASRTASQIPRGIDTPLPRATRPPTSVPTKETPRLPTRTSRSAGCTPADGGGSRITVWVPSLQRALSSPTAWACPVDGRDVGRTAWATGKGPGRGRAGPATG
jgi:hypothetical protein